MAKTLTFESTISLTRVALFLSGIRLEDVKFGRFTEILFKNLFYFNCFWLHTDVIGEIFAVIEGIQIGTSFVELSETAPCMLLSILSTVKCIFLFQHENVIIKVVAKLKSMHPENDTNDENHVNEDVDTESDETIIKNSMKFLNSMNHLLNIMTLVLAILFVLVPAVTMAYVYYTTGETELRFPYLTKYYFNHYTKKRWPFVYLHQAWSTAIVVAFVIGSDTLFYTLCVLVEMHFRLLCNRFENFATGTEEEVKKNFKECITWHQELIQLADDAELLYSKSNLFNILTASVLICLNGFNITVTDDVTVIIRFLSFLGMTLCQIYLMCYFADLLMKSSTAVSLAIYKSPWYKTDNSIKKSVLFVLKRTHKPCKLTAYNFVDLNLNAFTKILSRSWSYFALLRTMYD